MSWVSSPMMSRLEAIWLSSRKGFSNSDIAASISSLSASRSARLASRWVRAGFVMALSREPQERGRLRLRIAEARVVQLPAQFFFRRGGGGGLGLAHFGRLGLAQGLRAGAADEVPAAAIIAAVDL